MFKGGRILGKEKHEKPAEKERKEGELEKSVLEEGEEQIETVVTRKDENETSKFEEGEKKRSRLVLTTINSYKTNLLRITH